MSQIQSHKIGIIGAGVSGITAAKQLAHYDPIVFEATNSIGGVWRHCSFHNTKLQTRACEYEFSDFPLPNSSDPDYFPPTAKILEYLDDYVARFDLLKFVKFNSKVVKTRYVGDPERLGLKPGEYGPLLDGTPAWEVAVQSNQTNDVQWYSFELLVVCTGKHGEIPRMPNFEPRKGPEVFSGQVMHSVDYAKLDKVQAQEVIQGKRVVIIGFKKSAVDLAKDFADINQGVGPITMVVRSLHWPVPHYWIWGIPFHMLYMSRFAQFLWEQPNQGMFKTVASFLLLPLRKAISKFIESYLLWKLPLKKYGLKPDHPFEEDYASCQMPILPNNFFDEVEKGNIKFKKAKNWWFCSDGVEFNDGTRLGADVVILATGYDGRQKLRQVLPEPYLSYMLKPNFLPLYRGTIHPMIPNMAFVGYIETLANLGTGELRCTWLASLADRKFKLPSIEKMLEQSRKEEKVLKRSTRFYQKQGISVSLINHNDEICRDMGVKAWRKNNLLLEAFSPYVSKDYAD